MEYVADEKVSGLFETLKYVTEAESVNRKYSLTKP
jgi:hypothetical protein